MLIRRYKQSDLDTISNLFYQTVHNVNCADYTAEQLCAWTNSPESLKTKQEILSEQYTLLAEIDGETVGFGSIDKNGCLDFLYVHKDYQRQGVATALCDELEKTTLLSQLTHRKPQNRFLKVADTIPSKSKKSNGLVLN